MPGALSGTKLENQHFISSAIEEKVLTRVDPWSEDTDEGDPAIVIACGDMHQAPDRLQHCWDRVTRKAQLILVNGGGLRLDDVSPANRPLSFVPYLVQQIDEAIALKEAQLGRKIKRIIPYFDYECGIAKTYNLTVKQCLCSSIHAKRYLKERYDGRQVMLKFYLDNPRAVLGPHHQLVLEHPNANALSFYFGAKEMGKFIAHYDRGFSPAMA